MDIMAHSLWSLVLLPGKPTIAKVALGIAPDVVVFALSLSKQAIKGKMQPGFKTRTKMMNWYHRKENKWVLNLYKYTHSLVIWTAVILPIFLYFYFVRNIIPWFLLAAPIHILMDIPTHDNNSFPVQFLTPFSKVRINGMHWSKPLIFIGNYVLIIAVFYFRLFVIRK
ncbi:MAG: hypothetical protein K8S23_12510 [Candidatus Cloacimonetes bacterium]|nr:hypothetical protein [Candidatus Cloacimonadota bacterium]